MKKDKKIIDILTDQVQDKGPICLGLDTDISYIPKDFHKGGSLADRILAFNKEIIDATKDLVAIYKLQIAFYEQEGLQGMLAYKNTLDYLRDQGALTIGDSKRGDIVNTGHAYAKAHLTGDFEVDFVTVNPYIGFDTLTPYLPYLDQGNKGLFVLVKTSNPGSEDIEGLDSGGKKVYHHVGDHLRDLGQAYMGDKGYSAIGAVVGATSPDELASLRKTYPSMFFLIPGYGAQGGGASDVKQGLIGGNGAIINSSRGLITGHLKDDSIEIGRYARQAVEQMKKDLSQKEDDIRC